jgi:hypothetical protein
LNKEFARRFVMAGAVIFNRFVVFHRYLPDKGARREAPGFASRLIKGE